MLVRCSSLQPWFPHFLFNEQTNFLWRTLDSRLHPQSLLSRCAVTPALQNGQIRGLTEQNLYADTEDCDGQKFKATTSKKHRYLKKQ